MAVESLWSVVVVLGAVAVVVAVVAAVGTGCCWVLDGPLTCPRNEAETCCLVVVVPFC